MTQETAHMPLDERGLEAAYETLGMPDHPDQRRPIEPAIRAYLQTAAADVSGLVERLRERAESYRMGGPSSEHTAALLDEAASTLQTLSASNAALEAEIERLREVLEMISHMHDGNPPLPLADMPELDYARRTISTMRWEARAALSAPKGGAS